MPTNIFMNASEDNASMVIEHSNGAVTILPFDDAVQDGVPAIAEYMGENVMETLHHFMNGDHLQIDDDALCVPHIIR